MAEKLGLLVSGTLLYKDVEFDAFNCFQCAFSRNIQDHFKGIVDPEIKFMSFET